MHLKTVFISNYKNLKNFTLNFDGESFIDVFVGKNGSGKSNLFEALIEVFRHIYEFEKDKGDPGFEYSITYEISGNETEIAWKAGKLSINGKVVQTIGKTPLPDNVLIYYSGQNDTVPDLVQKYEANFGKRIKKADFDESRRFIGIGPKYKALLLALLLMQKPGNKARLIIEEKLCINQVGSEMRLELRRPIYAKKTIFDIGNQQTDRYWKPEGITKAFLDRLSKCISTANNGPVRSEGYFPNDDRYTLYLDITKIQQEFADLSAQELFRQFDNLKTLGMLADISIPLKLSSGLDASIAHFSDGQFQSVYIYSIVELFKDRNCLTLLDEPDAFLHPDWQHHFLKQVLKITGTTSKKNHVLMSSHSAVTLISHEKKQVNLFETDEYNVVCRSTGKDYAINKLSTNLIKYKEDEQILSILRNIRIEELPVLFTEGSTDPDIIKEAWRKLYDEPTPFIPIYAFCCDYLRRALQDDRIINEMNGRPLFGVFDFDEAYDEWNGLNEKKDWALKCNDPYLGLRTENTGKNVHAFIIPVPKIAKIEAQVIRDRGSKSHFANKSIMEIEHLFYREQTQQHFKTEQQPGSAEVIIFSGKKTRFAREVVPTLDADVFEVFRPMFDFIKSKCAEGPPA